jgi:nucleoside-triphosphatase
MSIKGRIAITGRPGVGKTTLIERVLEVTRLRAGGMVTHEIRVCGRRVGFAVTDVATGTEGVLAHVHRPAGPKVGRYTVDIESLENVGVAAIHAAIRSAELVVIDEIAPMELRSPAFAPAVEAALESDRALLISTHANASHPVAHRVRRELELHRVRLNNRDRLVGEIAEALEAAV